MVAGAGQAAPAGPGASVDLGVIPRGAVAARDGRVVWTGPEAEIAAALEVPDDALVVDVEGAAVVPGFVDAHAHLVVGGRARGRVRRPSGRRHLPGDPGGRRRHQQHGARDAGGDGGAARRPGRAPPRLLPAARHHDARGQDRLRPHPRGRAQAARRRQGRASGAPRAHRPRGAPDARGVRRPRRRVHRRSSATRSCRRSPARPSSSTSSATRARSPSRRRGACSRRAAPSATGSRSTPRSWRTPGGRRWPLRSAPSPPTTSSTSPARTSRRSGGRAPSPSCCRARATRCTRPTRRRKELLAAGVTVALATDFNPGSCYSENLQMAISLGLPGGPADAGRGPPRRHPGRRGRARPPARGRQPRAGQALRPARPRLGDPPGAALPLGRQPRDRRRRRRRGRRARPAGRCVILADGGPA